MGHRFASIGVLSRASLVTDYGQPSALTDYRRNLTAGDINGDGRDDIIYVSSGHPVDWCNSFNLSRTLTTSWDWKWAWSNYSSSAPISTWPYPIGSDRLFIGNIDTDSKHEMLFLKRDDYATWAEPISFLTYPLGTIQTSWSNNGICSLGNWALAGSPGTSTDYKLMRIRLGYPKCLLARRKYSTSYYIQLIEPSGNKSLHRYTDHIAGHCLAFRAAPRAPPPYFVRKPTRPALNPLGRRRSPA